MKIYLAGTSILSSIYKQESEIKPFQPTFFNSISKGYKISILETFWGINDYISNYYPYINFMLDSGAYSFMNASKERADNIIWEKYVDNLAYYVKKYNIDLFFELDIDSLVGYDKVLQLRKRLIEKSGKQPIPVMHKSRGVEEYKNMCSEFPYVALGTMMDYKDNVRVLRKMIDIAHSYNCKIHGLGFTRLKLLPLLPFDSVDSTSWTAGGRFGTIYQFKNGTLKKYGKTKSNQRLSSHCNITKHNFIEWVKYQRYAEEFF